ncbi:MAG: superfamily [Gemmataceae bacterium]|nr:superfamily [Gemmataceae bacterium]
MHRIDSKNAAEIAKAVKAGELPVAAKSLAEALARVMAELGPPPGATPSGDVREIDVVAAVRPAMVRHGVVMLPAAVEMLACEAVASGRGKSATRVLVRTTFRFVHGASGEKFEVQALGEGRDDGDRAAKNALAVAMSSVLRQSFCFAMGDERGGAPAQSLEVVHPWDAGGRGLYAQEFGRCKTRADYLAVCQRIAEDVRVGVLTEADRDALKDVARDTSARLPVQPAAAK